MKSLSSLIPEQFSPSWVAVSPDIEFVLRNSSIFRSFLLPCMCFLSFSSQFSSACRVKMQTKVENWLVLKATTYSTGKKDWSESLLLRSTNSMSGSLLPWVRRRPPHHWSQSGGGGARRWTWLSGAWPGRAPAAGWPCRPRARAGTSASACSTWGSSRGSGGSSVIEIRQKLVKCWRKFLKKSELVMKIPGYSGRSNWMLHRNWK